MDLLIGIAIFVVAFIFGGGYGWHLRERHAERVLNHMIQQVEKETIQSEHMIPITIEEHNGHLYVYNKENNSFLAQAATADELEEVLMERFPGKKFSCNEKTLKEFGLLS